MVEYSADASFSYKLDGTVLSWNHGAQRLCGSRAEEMIGKPNTALVPPDRPSDVDRILARIRDGERLEGYETVRVAKGGRMVDVALTVSPVRDQTGEIIEASAIARDISEQKREDRYR